MIVDVPDHHDVKSDSIVSRNFGLIDQYMAIEVDVDSITDFRYIVYKKSEYTATVYDSDCGAPMLLLRHRSHNKNIVIPAKRVIDVTNAKNVHNGDNDIITNFDPKLDII